MILIPLKDVSGSLLNFLFIQFQILFQHFLCRLYQVFQVDGDCFSFVVAMNIFTNSTDILMKFLGFSIDSVSAYWDSGVGKFTALNNVL